MLYVDCGCNPRSTSGDVALSVRLQLPRTAAENHCNDIYREYVTAKNLCPARLKATMSSVDKTTASGP